MAEIQLHPLYKELYSLGKIYFQSLLASTGVCIGVSTAVNITMPGLIHR